MKSKVFLLFAATFCFAADFLPAQDLRSEAATALKRATSYFRENVATNGGYVYYYSPDLATRYGEGFATKDQIWVQPPGTPTVGMAFLRFWRLAKDPAALEAATDAAKALIHGQLESGGWTNAIDFDPNGSKVSQYRNGKGRGRNYSTLDDGITQAALQLLIRVDQAHGFRDAEIHEAAKVGLDALLAAQFENGAFPQVWQGPLKARPSGRASYPEYDWKTENRIKEYWDLPTLNDGVAGSVTATLLDAHRAYPDDERYLAALRKLGGFLLLARLPEPQPAWAQQYTANMNPAWARPFEPPAVAGRESQDVLKALVVIARATRDARFLEPIPRSVEYLRGSLLPDGQLARYYELISNRPLYMSRRGKVYSLTYDDSDLPNHYGWKVESFLDEIEASVAHLRETRGAEPEPEIPEDAEIREIVDALDAEGRWMSKFDGELLVGQPKFQPGQEYLSSAVFAENVEKICTWFEAKR